MTARLLPHRREDVVALGEGGTRTAADLRDDASRVARALGALPPGDVALACADRYHFAVGLLGAWQAGRAVALPPSAQDEAVRAVARATASGLLLHDRAGAPDGVDVAALLGGPSGGGDLPLLDPATRVVTLWTSGTTGAPQAVPKTAGQLLGEAAVLCSIFGIGPGARVACTVPSHHVYGLLFSVLAPLVGGGAFGRDTPLHAEAVAAALRRDGATHLASSPAHLRALCALDSLPPLRCAFSSGAALPPDVGGELASRLALRVVEVYGSTETGGMAWRAGAADPWRPFPGVEATIGDDEILRVDSPFLPPATERPFATGDRAVAAGGGSFRLLGRADGIVKVAGKRVSVSEVEARILATPGVRDAGVIAAAAGGVREVELRAAVVAPGLDEAALRAALSPWLDPVAVPRRIRLVDALPREASGKLRRDRLATLLAPAPEPGEIRVEHRVGGPDAACFAGHFDGFPILPGVFQLAELVLRPARAQWPDLADPVRLRRLKFARMIRPGEALVIRLARPTAAPRLDFDVLCGEQGCASGVVEFEEAP